MASRNIVIKTIYVVLNQLCTGAHNPERLTSILPYATAFPQVGLFLDKLFPRIAFEKPITSNCVIDDKLLIRN